MSDRRNWIEFVLAGIAGCGAGVCTNPLEVVKTRMQLQGELRMKGHYTVHYRHVLHAFYAIVKNDGLLAAQKGLVPAMWYQFFMNGTRLGSYQVFTNLGLIYGPDDQVSYPRTVVVGALSGSIGALIASPLYMIKTQLQSASNKLIAVGHQHDHSSMTNGLGVIYKEYGVIGLWRGVTAAMARVSVGSAVQLSTFTNTKQYIERTQVFTRGSWLNAFTASMMSGVAVTAAMTPFDVVATRMYNQGVTPAGGGQLYTSLSDCFVKIMREEGLWGFYKGWGASYVRLGPHTMLSLMLWHQLSSFYHRSLTVAN